MGCKELLFSNPISHARYNINKIRVVIFDSLKGRIHTAGILMEHYFILLTIRSDPFFHFQKYFVNSEKRRKIETYSGSYRR